MHKYLTLLVFVTACTGNAAGPPVRSDQPWRNLEGNMIFERAEAYYAAGRYPEALLTYKEYHGQYPETYRGNDAFYRMAQCLEALGDRVEAAVQYRKTGLTYGRCDLAPSAFLRAGELFEIEGCPKDAVWCYEAAMKYHSKPESMRAAERLFDLQRRAGTHQPPPTFFGRLAAGIGDAASSLGSAVFSSRDTEEGSSLFATRGTGPSIDPFNPDQSPSGTTLSTSGARTTNSTATAPFTPTPRSGSSAPPGGLIPGDVVDVFFGEPSGGTTTTTTTATQTST